MKPLTYSEAVDLAAAVVQVRSWLDPHPELWGSDVPRRWWAVAIGDTLDASRWAVRADAERQALRYRTALADALVAASSRFAAADAPAIIRSEKASPKS